MKFLIDNQLPVQLAVYLRQRGHDCVHVLEIGLDESSDLALWEHCIGQQRILISKDQDFVFLANRPEDSGRLVWLRLGNCRNTALLQTMEGVCDTLEECFVHGQRIVEVR